jgi:hypothetical protein
MTLCYASLKWSSGVICNGWVDHEDDKGMDRMVGWMGINIKKGKHIPSCTLMHVLKPCKFKYYTKVELQLSFQRARIHAARLAVKMVGGSQW